MVDLKEDGANIAVTHANHKEFIELILETRFKETERQMNWVKKGVHYVIDPMIMSFLNWNDIELRACGDELVETETLKKISSYNVGEDHKIVVWFWQMFEEWDQEHRKLYLKFVWGRSKIPSDTKHLRYKHEVHVYSHLAPEGLPEAHTCFFQLDLPEYKEYEIMKKRVTTAIEMCGEIDTDYSPAGIAPEAGGDNSYGGGGYDEE